MKDTPINRYDGIRQRATIGSHVDSQMIENLFRNVFHSRHWPHGTNRCDQCHSNPVVTKSYFLRGHTARGDIHMSCLLLTPPSTFQVFYPYKSSANLFPS